MKSRFFLVQPLIVLSIMISLFSFKVRAEMPKPGDVAPLFSAMDQNGTNFNLADLIGKKVVLLYFYPKDFTGGCTKEACGLRDRMGELQADNVAVVGVSHDDVDSHKRFATQYNLDFILLADPQNKIISLYDVKMPLVSMSKRVSFLIGLDGKIVHVTDAMNPQRHFDEMKEAIAGLSKN